MASSIARTAKLFQKLLSGRYITYHDLQVEENINKRTALRRIAEAREVFGPALADDYGDNGRKRFWLKTDVSGWLGHFKNLSITPEEMATMDKAAQLLRREGLSHEGHLVESLRAKLHGVLEKKKEALKTDTDTQAITDAWGIATRPGPYLPVKEEITERLRKALLWQRRVQFRYRTERGRESVRQVSPAGLLYGGAPRLVAQEEGRPLAQYRLDRMSEVEMLEGQNPLSEDALHEYIQNLFGSFGESPVDVRWRFHPSAPSPEKWRFHPTQKVRREEDGSVIVSFRAGGLDDMARHVIGWWDWIEVEKPKSLRRKILQMRLAGLAPLLDEFADRRTASRIRNLAEDFGAGKADDR